MNGNNYESYFSMSIAYLEVGKIAAKNKNNTEEYQNAVAYQLYHALELFVKYAILKKKDRVTYTHDLSDLFDEYNLLYKGNAYRLEHLFDFSSYEPCELNIDEKKMYEKHINEFKPKIMDQHLRYPQDHRIGGYSFKIESNDFASIKNKLLKIYGEINHQ
jgi:HEPN domain-containing protein